MRMLLLWTLLLVGMALLTAAVLRSEPAKDRELARAIEQWEGAGGVRDPESLRPRPADADANAAKAYLQAIDLLSGVADEQRDAILATPWQASRLQLRRLVSSEALALSATRQASRIEHCRWPEPHVDRRDGERAAHVPGLVTLARLLGAEATLRGWQGDGSAALKAVEALWRMAAHLGSEPGAVAVNMQLHEDNRALLALEAAFADEPPPDAEKLARMLTERDYGALRRRAAIGEVALILALFDEDALAEVEGPLGRIGVGGVNEAQRLSADVTHLLDSVRRRLEQWEMPYDQQASFDKMTLSRTRPVTFETVLRLEHTNRIAARVEARRAVAVTALHLSLHAREHGRLPARLRDLEHHDALPGDPINGASVAYTREGETSFTLRIDADAIEMDDVVWRWNHRPVEHP